MIEPPLSDDEPAVTARTLRQFVLLPMAMLGGSAGWQALVKHDTRFAAILAGVAIVVGVVGLPRPERVRPFYSMLLALSHPIGRIVSVVVLAVLYYSVFTMMGLLFRLIGRDALHIRRPDRASHWTPKPKVADLRSYLRQS
jgi:hypothetical protein